MSKTGIDLAAKIFSQMQEARQELFRMGSPEYKNGKKIKDGDNADILLAQMLSDGNDAMKDAFTAITMGFYPKIKGKRERVINPPRRRSRS